MSTFLITGGAGFIGSHLVDRLLLEGHRVRVLDDLSTGFRTNLSSNVELIIGDVAHLGTVREAFVGISACFHLAAIASVTKSHTDWHRTHEVNATGAVNVFEAARIKQTPIIYASSSAIYGEASALPLNERDRANPQSAYGTDKYFNELSGRIAWNIHGIANMGFRFFNIYGPRQHPSSPYSGVVSLFKNAITHKKVFHIYGDGNQTRDFVYVSDVITMLSFAMAKLMRQRSGFHIYNCCTGTPTSINELACIFENMVGYKVARCYHKPRSGEIYASVGDPTFTSQKLGISPAIDLTRGLRRTLDYKQQEERSFHLSLQRHGI